MLVSRWFVPACRRVPTLVAVLLPALVAAAAVQDDDPDALRPGLVFEARHPEAPGVAAVRVYPTPARDWGLASPDVRLPADGFRVRATGLLLVQAPGPYRFFARTDGKVRLRLGDDVVLSVEGDGDGEPRTLRPGFVPITIDYEHTGGPARLAIDWEGPGFGREPLPARLLSHVPGQGSSPDAFERGRRLADRLGCANCHALPGVAAHPDLGPPLRNPAAWLRPGAVERRLVGEDAGDHAGSMPRYGKGLSAADAADIAAFLGTTGPRPRLGDEVRMALNVGSFEKGRLLFRSVGCLGCHAKEDAPDPAGVDRGAGAPALTGLGRRRSAELIAAFLEHPRGGRVASRHRPDLRLSAEEAAHLGVYLATGPEATPTPEVHHGGPTGDPARGRRLAERLRCASCHAVEDLPAPAADVPIATGQGGGDGCLAVEPTDRPIPHFALDAEERRALRAYLDGRPSGDAPSLDPMTAAEDVVRRRNCLGCHARDAVGGEAMAGRLAPLLANDRELGGLKGTLTPPNLTAVGDKLRHDYLLQSIRGEAPTARPWLAVRMPAFAFEPGEPEAIAGLFEGQDRMAPPDPAGPNAATAPGPDPAAQEVGARLLGQRGFGCLSCHVVAGRIPPGGEPETLGPDLALAHRRMSERYFRRWISDPQRVIAGTPMPQFLKPVAGEGLPASLDEQVEAVWSLIRSPSLGSAVAFGTREVLRPEGDRAAVVRDMVLVPGLPETPYTPRGLAIGLKNGASLLFDTDRLTWLAWWRGGFLSRTKSGRLWEWHPEGRRVWTAPARLPTVALAVGPDGSILAPTADRERFGTFRAVEFVGSGVRLSYGLHDGRGGTVEVEETLRPVGDGWERHVAVSGWRGEGVPSLVEQPPRNARPAPGGLSLEWEEGDDRVRCSIEADAPGPLDTPGARLWNLRPVGPGRFEATTRVEFPRR